MSKCVTLGPEAVVYMREALAHSGPLTDALRQVPFEDGHITTYVPERTSAEEVLRFRAVFSASSTEGGQAYTTMEHYVHRLLQQGGSKLLVMGSQPALPQDWRGLNHPRLGREWAEWFTCEGRVYFFAIEASESRRVADVFSDVQAPTTFGVVARDLVRVPPLHRTIARTELADVVRLPTHVLVGVYDSAGILIWSKRDESGSLHTPAHR